MTVLRQKDQNEIDLVSQFHPLNSPLLEKQQQWVIDALVIGQMQFSFLHTSLGTHLPDFLVYREQ